MDRISGEKTHQLTIRNTKMVDDNTQYYCKCTDLDNTSRTVDSDTATLTIDPTAYLPSDGTVTTDQIRDYIIANQHNWER